MVMVRSKEGCTVGLGRQSQGGAVRWYCFDPRLLDTMVLQCDGGTVLPTFCLAGKVRLGRFDSIGLSRFDWTPGHCYAGQTPNRTF